MSYCHHTQYTIIHETKLLLFHLVRKLFTSYTRKRTKLSLSDKLTLRRIDIKHNHNDFSVANTKIIFHII